MNLQTLLDILLQFAPTIIIVTVSNFLAVVITVVLIRRSIKKRDAKRDKKLDAKLDAIYKRVGSVLESLGGTPTTTTGVPVVSARGPSTTWTPTASNPQMPISVTQAAAPPFGGFTWNPTTGPPTNPGLLTGPQPVAGDPPTQVIDVGRHGARSGTPATPPPEPATESVEFQPTPRRVRATELIKRYGANDQ